MKNKLPRHIHLQMRHKPHAFCWVLVFASDGSAFTLIPNRNYSCWNYQLLLQSYLYLIKEKTNWQVLGIIKPANILAFLKNQPTRLGTPKLESWPKNFKSFDQVYWGFAKGKSFATKPFSKFCGNETIKTFFEIYCTSNKVWFDFLMAIWRHSLVDKSAENSGNHLAISCFSCSSNDRPSIFFGWVYRAIWAKDFTDFFVLRLEKVPLWSAALSASTSLKFLLEFFKALGGKILSQSHIF